MKLAMVAALALSAASGGYGRPTRRPTFPPGQDAVDSCPIDLYVLVDTSGSMNDKNDKCASFLTENGIAIQQNKKACWQVLTKYATAMEEKVQSVCKQAGQNPARVTFLGMKCPGTDGKDHRVLLETTNNVDAIEDAFRRLFLQSNSGYSCSLGALKALEVYVQKADDEMDAAGLARKTPITLMLSDGNLQPIDSINSSAQAEKLLKQQKLTVVGAAPFLTKAEKMRLQKLSSQQLVFGAEDENSLDGLSLTISSTRTELTDLAACSQESIDCFVRRSALMQQATASSCATREALFSALAQCAGAGCDGIDLFNAAKLCSSTRDSECAALDCEDITTHINAQRTYDGADGEGEGFDSTSPWSGARKPFETSVPRSGALETVWSLGGSASPSGPALALGESVVVAFNSHNGSRVAKVGANSGEIQWSSEIGAAVLAPMVILGDALENDLLVGDASGRLHLLSLANGSSRRVVALGAGAITAAAAVPQNSGFVFVAQDAVAGTAGAYLHKVPISMSPVAQGSHGGDGWKRHVCSSSTADKVVGGVLLARNGAVLVGCLHGTLEAYDYQTGERLFRLLSGKQRLAAAPVLQGDIAAQVFSDSNGSSELVVFNVTSRTTLWTDRLPATSVVSPVLKEGGVIVFADDSSIRKYDLKTGNLLLTSSSAPRDSRGTVVLDSSNTLVVTAGSYLNFISTDTLMNVRAPLDVGAAILGVPVLEGGAVLLSSSAWGLARVAVSSTIPQGTRRFLTAENNTTWPGAAVALAVILGILFLVLLVWFLSVVLRQSRRL